MALVVTDTGRERIMFHYGAGTELTIDSVQVGTLNAAERYDAAADAVALQDATPTVYSGESPMISGVSAQYNIQLSGADEVVASEIGLFEGTNLILLWAEQAADLFTKPANGNVLFAVGWSLSDGTISSVTATVQAYPIATEAQARAGTANDALMTPLRVHQAIDETEPGNASDTERGIVALTTADLFRATLGGADPDAADEDKVLTLQTLFESIKAYEDGSLPAAIPNNGTIELVYET